MGISPWRFLLSTRRQYLHFWKQQARDWVSCYGLGVAIDCWLVGCQSASDRASHQGIAHPVITPGFNSESVQSIGIEDICRAEFGGAWVERQDAACPPSTIGSIVPHGGQYDNQELSTKIAIKTQLR
jgi:hypothetical protein